jgi:serine/threonine protein kinase
LNISIDTPQRNNFLKNTITNQEIFLGRGSFGCVFKAVYKQRKVAVKVISKHDPFKFTSLKREKNILKFYHPNIIRIFKIVETKECGAMIMERFSNGGKSLQFVLDHVKNKLHLVHRIRLMRDVACGLKFCHENSIIHRDLKPDNIMIVPNCEDEFTCKLFDFGCSFVYGEKAKESNCSGDGIMVSKHAAATA